MTWLNSPDFFQRPVVCFCLLLRCIANPVWYFIQKSFLIWIVSMAMRQLAFTKSSSDEWTKLRSFSELPRYIVMLDWLLYVFNSICSNIRRWVQTWKHNCTISFAMSHVYRTWRVVINRFYCDLWKKLCQCTIVKHFNCINYGQTLNLAWGIHNNCLWSNMPQLNWLLVG